MISATCFFSHLFVGQIVALMFSIKALLFFVEQISAPAQVVLNEVYYKQAYFARVGLILKKKNKHR